MKSYLFALILIIIPINNLTHKELSYYILTGSFNHKFSTKDVIFSCNESGTRHTYLCSLDTFIYGNYFSFILAPHAIPEESMMYYFKEINKMLRSNQYVMISGKYGGYELVDPKILNWPRLNNKNLKISEVFFDLHTIQTLEYSTSSSQKSEACINYFQGNCTDKNVEKYLKTANVNNF